MIKVTKADLEKNLDKYLSFAEGDEVEVVNDGITIAIISQPARRRSLVDELIGIIPDEGLDYDDLKYERIMEHKRFYRLTCIGNYACRFSAKTFSKINLYIWRNNNVRNLQRLCTTRAGKRTA